MNRRNFFSSFSLFQTPIGLPPKPTDLKVRSIEVDGPAAGTSATRFFMRSGVAPSDTVSEPGKPAWDAVMYLDSADGLPKVKTRNGVVYAMVLE